MIHLIKNKEDEVIPGVAFLRDLCPRDIKTPTVLTWTFIFFHTGTFAIIEEANWTLTARFTLCGVLGRWKDHSHRKQENITGNVTNYSLKLSENYCRNW